MLWQQMFQRVYVGFTAVSIASKLIELQWWQHSVPRLWRLATVASHVTCCNWDAALWLVEVLLVTNSRELLILCEVVPLVTSRTTSKRAWHVEIVPMSSHHHVTEPRKRMTGWLSHLTWTKASSFERHQMNDNESNFKSQFLGFVSWLFVS